MCLALYKPAKASLNQAEMESAFKANPDGAGFAYYDPALRRVVIQRGYFTFMDLWTDLIPIMDDKLPLILHFRWATHGDVNTENCHPFELHDGALIHNGIISGLGEVSYSYAKTSTCDTKGGCDDRSDTREFVEDMLAGMGALELKLAKKLIEHTIGWSKLVTIHNDGSVVIFNEDKGHWRKGVWYSNDSYLPYKAKSAVPTGATKVWNYQTTNLTPVKGDKATEPSLFAEEDDDVDTRPNVCDECGAFTGISYTYDPVDDCFLATCNDCGHVWLVDGADLTQSEWYETFNSCDNQTRSY